MEIVVVYLSIIFVAYIRCNKAFDGLVENVVTVLVGLSWAGFVLFKVLF